MKNYGWLVLLLLLALRGMATPVQILATGDMHGWLKGRPVDGYLYGGAASMLGYWKAREGYAPDKFLVVSTGDNVSGQPISTLLDGEPDIDVMNAMGFQASALSTHEFDFGRGQLLRLATAAKFPFLAANLLNADGTPAAMAKPFVIVETQGVKVGIVGLLNRTAASHPNIGILKLAPYEETLRIAAGEAKAQGAQVIIVVASISDAELAALARLVPDLHIPVMFGGNTHDFDQQYVVESNTWVMSNGANWAGYGRIDLEVDTQDGSARVEGIKQVRLQQRAPALDQGIVDIVSRWQQRLGPDYNQPLGVTAGLLRSTSAVAFTLHCWLAADQAANFAMVNLGGVRQDIPAGNITKADVITMLPFDDKLYRIKLTGKQLLAYHAPRGEQVVINDLRVANNTVMLDRDNQPLNPDAVYQVIMCDYLYNVSEGLRAADPNPVVVLPDWRNPLYKWLADHPTADKRFVEKLAVMEKVLIFGEKGILAGP